MLRPYRVLDLTDEKGFFCGKLLGDLGADVIKIERPGGDPARNIGPFYHDEVDPEKSLFWWAYNTSKRGMTLDISTAEGRGIFLQLVKLSDFVIESFPPHHLEHLGLGYETLAETNPGIILTSISGFGQDGPHAKYKAPDIVCMAMGGLMNLTGDPDRPPLRITVPQAYLHASSEAAVGSLIALWHKEATGEGQWVDISAQECVAWECFHNQNCWNMNRVNFVRSGGCMRFGNSLMHVPTIFQCKDGYVHFMLFGALASTRHRYLVEWMRSEGFDTTLLDTIDWDALSPFTMSLEKVIEVLRSFEPFFITKTRQELFQAASSSGMLISPSNSIKEVMEDIHLKTRGFWQAVRDPELGSEEILYPGAPWHATGNPCHIRCRAPLIGEHNLDILHGELGMSKDEVSDLQQRGII